MPPEVRATHRRGAAVRALVLDTVIDVLTESGYGFSIDEVAARAEVHKTTIYRNWATKPQLVAAAVERFADRDVEVRRTDDPLADLVCLAESVGTALRTLTGSNTLRSVVAAAADDPELLATAERFFAGRYRLALEIIDGARAAGVIRDDIDSLVLWTTMGNPLHLRAILGHPADESTTRATIDQVLCGALPTSPNRLASSLVEINAVGVRASAGVLPHICLTLRG